MPLDRIDFVVLGTASLIGVWWFGFRQRLSHIPGPSNPSWLIGMPNLIIILMQASSHLSGNLMQIFDLNAWSFHAYLYKTFGSVVRIHTMFNVRPTGLSQIFTQVELVYRQKSFSSSTRLPCSTCSSRNLTSTKSRMLQSGMPRETHAPSDSLSYLPSV